MHIILFFRRSRVCSKHFLQGRPTHQNPVPVLNMGYVVEPEPEPPTQPEPTQTLLQDSVAHHITQDSAQELVIDHEYTCRIENSPDTSRPASPCIFQRKSRRSGIVKKKGKSLATNKGRRSCKSQKRGYFKRFVG